MAIVAVVNNKGGVGKTFLAVNLAHALACRGHKILAIDLDSQANASDILAPRAGRSLYDIYTGQAEPGQCVCHTSYTGLMALPNHQDTSALEPELARREDYGWFALHDHIGGYARQNYDTTILDCPPNLGAWTMQAMIASDFILVPLAAGSKHALDGMARTVQAIEDIAATEGIAHSGSFLRLIINMVDRRTTISKVAIQTIHNMYPEKTLQATIPQNTSVQQAELIGKTVLRHAPSSLASRALRAAAAELEPLIAQPRPIKGDV